MIGKRFFCTGGHCFFQVTHVIHEKPLGASFTWLHVVTLDEDRRQSQFEILEIGEELFELPDSFSQADIDQYAALAKQRKDATQRMHDMAMNIVLYKEFVETDQIPF